MYRIENWFPTKRDYHGAAFGIILTPKWMEAVSKSDLNQEKCDALIKNIGKQILLGHGFTHAADRPEMHLKIFWNDEIGTSLIQVPGNACSIGYDPYSQFGCRSYAGEKLLTCHNTDSLSQASIQLTLFLRIAEYLYYEEYERNKNK